MLLRETIHKTKVLLHKSLRKFKSFFLGRYKKLPRSLSFNPFHGHSGNARTYTSDHFYNEFYDLLQSDINSRSVQIQSNSFETARTEPRNWALGNSIKRCDDISMSIPEVIVLKENCKYGKKGDLDSRNMIEGSKVLAQKMKELEMIESGDIEHELDIEEALHYYSRLTSPVYLDIVNKFFMDMKSEFSLPQPYVSI
ncbi:hypothetical protein TanjilG_16323 [Lupinus angustifolius]|uniref:OVATE domain-containing protein n=1 Tax=Lupinus angustifolius TaxID=3871 RepID=A0A1J7H8D2_LUPAN|nr:PREDICTED: uncharacterized protein LOC109350996 [Lupinus angustifolius]OIW09096.1 hypothetical protein TanjilG_16323 [Lupinus angustifolius]